MFTATEILLYRLCLGTSSPHSLQLKDYLNRICLCVLFEAIVGMQEVQGVLQMSPHDTAQDAACIIMNKAEGE